jgi:hypothetical protein
MSKITIEICDGGFLIEKNGKRFATANKNKLVQYVRELISEEEEPTIKKTELKDQ